MARKYFEKFSDLIEWRKNCPVCSKPLTYEIKTTVNNESGNNLFTKLEKHFDHEWNKSGNFDADTTKDKIIVATFQPAISNIINIDELDVSINFDNNTYFVNDIETAPDFYNLKIYCKHDMLDYEYNAVGEFDINLDFVDETSIPKENGKYVLQLDNISVFYEQYKLCNLHLEDEKPNGNLIKIINDYNINKTSFAVAEVNLDNSFGAFREKRINLVGEEFFKFHDGEKVFARINSVFLLNEK